MIRTIYKVNKGGVRSQPKRCHRVVIISVEKIIYSNP